MMSRTDMTDNTPILAVKDLVVQVGSQPDGVRLLDRVSFEVAPGEVLGVVGESGSGKSITMLAAMGLLPQGLRIASGDIWLRGRKINGLSFEEMRTIRGREMSMIFQDPMTSLNPVRRIGSQIGEAIRIHNRHLSKTEIHDRTVALLAEVGIPDPERRAAQYPNEFSGGMRQRAMIAMAIANDPVLLIADEPTTALDVTIQAQVMEVLAKARARTGAAMILITHDLGLVAETADRIGVMYGGRIIEKSSIARVFGETAHPYSAGLLASLPRISEQRESLYSIPGHVPDMRNRPSGCVFHPRCAMSEGREPCRTEVPPLRPVADTHVAACHFAEETPSWAARQVNAAAVVPPSAVAARAKGPLTLEVTNVDKLFYVQKSRGWGRDTLNAVRDVSLEISKGETLGLVGESGCGKSTLGRVILGLHPATSGVIELKGNNLQKMSGRAFRAVRREMQVVFQDPYASLDPRMTIAEIVAEPLRINGLYDPKRVLELLRQVGLTPEAATRKPSEFSGGQRQRIAIARALALKPDLLILDEAVSALDVSIQAQIINLLKDLQNELGLSYLFISHDLSVVRHISDRVAVMYLGRIVETGTRDQVFDAPTHPYTQALLSSIPSPLPSGSARERIILRGDLPNPLNPPSGCPFRTRCFKPSDLCKEITPELRPQGGPGHLAACHFAETMPPVAESPTLREPARQDWGQA